jgi:hypothetical protein
MLLPAHAAVCCPSWAHTVMRVVGVPPIVTPAEFLDQLRVAPGGSPTPWGHSSTSRVSVMLSPCTKQPHSSPCSLVL